jgi:Dopey, N-terminal
MLDKLATSVSMSFFFQNIWLIMLTTPAARGTAVNYLSRRLPRLNADEDVTEIVGKDIGLMIRAFAAALEDDNLLVRRGTLDLLLQVMKIDSLAIKKAQPEDRAIIMKAAIGVVLRRDISLNRRLYSWLLGAEERHEDPLGYYKEHALVLLHTTLKVLVALPIDIAFR